MDGYLKLTANEIHNQQVFLSCTITIIHCSYLWNSYMTFIIKIGNLFQKNRLNKRDVRQTFFLTNIENNFLSLCKSPFPLIIQYRILYAYESFEPPITCFGTQTITLFKLFPYTLYCTDNLILWGCILIS